VADSHATLTRREGAWVVVDRGSANGTYVNGHRVAGEHPLPGECALRVGDVILKFREVAGAAPPPTSTRGVGGFFGRLAKLWKG
jgi:pSer/pThr/pTyr-binding forkhead associated (FHA) protein